MASDTQLGAVRGPRARHSNLPAVLIRFLFGLAGVLGVGLVVYGREMLLPESRTFPCLGLGALAAGVLSLVRASRLGQALVLVAVYGGIQLGLARTAGWPVAGSSAVLASGILLVAVINDLLARRGLSFGKFLVVGPLLGGVFLAAGPLTEFHTMNAFNAAQVLLRQSVLGVVIGNGVGLGIEIAEFLQAFLDREPRCEAGGSIGS